MLKRMILAAASTAALSAAPALAQERTELGMLECTIEGGPGFIIGSQKELACLFKPSEQNRPAEAYVGTVTKFGLDVGVTGKTIMQWLVLAPTTDPFPAGALTGDYVGASADASAVVGGGANVLIGGSNNTITLQPVSVQAQTGLNLAVGVSSFQLKMAKI
ncbi:DUF992 domain-containing protein [Mesorhizobium sp. 1B3]|uniref:DUF992 domain-containing protein n=1 Tax=Mesorhizobium sp. 1B3 TaxID=3243599 RepID=UPI003D97AF7D